MANATMSKDEILDAIGNMSVFELAELIDAFKSKFNVTISAAPVGAAPAAGGAGAAAAPAVEEQTEFSVNLKAAGAKKTRLSRGVRPTSILAGAPRWNGMRSIHHAAGRQPTHGVKAQSQH